MKPSLLIVYPNQFGYHTDSYKYCEYLRTDFNITYLSFNQGLELMDMPGIETIYVPYNIGRLKRLINFYRTVIRLSRNKSYDIVFTIQFKFCFLIGLLVRAKVKILDYRSGALNKTGLSLHINNLILCFDSLFFKHITVISEGVRKLLFQNSRKTMILPLGGDAITSGTHTYNRMDLLYVGSLNSREIHETVQGLGIFLQVNPELKGIVTYKIIGFGNNNDELRILNAITEYRLQDHVEFIGRKKFSELAQYFESSNIGVSYVPRKSFYEYQPVTKTFEYINSGLFTIATNTYENARVVNEYNGVLCDNTPHSFAEALEKTFRILHTLDDKLIRSSIPGSSWKEIVVSCLKPYLLKTLNPESINCYQR